MSKKSLGHNEVFEEISEVGATKAMPEEYPPLSEYEKQLFKYEGRALLGVNSDVTVLNIPDYFETIGDGVFKGKKTLKSVTFGKNIKIIGKEAFSGTGVVSVTFPDSVESIGEDAFRFCNNLETVHFGSGLRSIGGYAFTCCDGRTPSYKRRYCLDNRHAIDEEYNRYEVAEIGSYDYEQILKSGLTDAPLDKLSTVTFSEGVKRIGEYAFARQNVISLKLPNTLEKICEGAFACNTGLATLNLGVGVKSIEAAAFYKCGRLRVVKIPDSVTEIGYQAFTEESYRVGTGESLRWEKSGPHHISFGNGVKHIHKKAFVKIENSRIIFPDTVEVVESEAISTCRVVNLIVIGKNVKSMSGDSVGKTPDKIINRSKFLSGHLESIFGIPSNRIFDTSDYVDDPTRCPICAGEFKKKLFGGFKCRLCDYVKPKEKK